jgi:hypothetical protein
MKILFLALPLAAFAAPKLPPLVMTGPDSAKVVYADRCANGGNQDKANFDLFVKKMLADPRSKLAQLREKVLKEIKDGGEEPRGNGFYLTGFEQSYADREGCSQSSTSSTAIAVAQTGGNTDHTVAQALVTIDDDETEGVRTLSVRSITPIKIREE